jgi:tetratricopeptide (TPR) repeat protein
VDIPDLYPLHADFLSRLGLTFSHGDYAVNPLVEKHLATAVMLFKRSLDYHPDHRAFWGLGLVYQHQGRFDESIVVLKQGIEHHQESVDLHMALANSLIRLARYEEARACLEGFPAHPQAVDQIIRCCRLMADKEGERIWSERLRSLRPEMP